MTPELLKLREHLGTLRSIVDRLEFELVDDPNWAEPSDSSYLSEAERHNPDIAANVDAMNETNKLISWFGQDYEGYVGLWRGPSNRAPAASPVVRLDNEGQYSIVAMTIPDYLAISMPEEEFATTREALADAGFEVAFNPDAIWGAIESVEDPPNDYRNKLYRELKQSRGGSVTSEDPTMERGWTEPPPPPAAAPPTPMRQPEGFDAEEPDEPVTLPKGRVVSEARPRRTAPKKTPKKKAAKKPPRKAAPKKAAKAAPKKKIAKKPAAKKKPSAKKAPKKKARKTKR